MGNCNNKGGTKYFPDDYKTDFKGKVIVIGAGCSGMTAGYVLDKMGIEYEILEASGTYGGRIKHTTDFTDFPIDLGAEWIHAGISSRPPLLNDLLENQNNDPKFPTILYKVPNRALGPKF